MVPTDLSIEFKKTSKVYRSGFWGKKQTALASLDLQVPSGTIYGFLGANGAGKTTGIKILLGLQFATSGEVLLWGKPAHLAESKCRVGYMPERPYFHDTMNANEFLNFHRNLFGSFLGGKKTLSNGELLELVGIPQVGKKRLRDFSKGMLQRIGIAQALVNDPDLVVLDEPTSGLDPLGRRDVRNLIQELAQRGKTIFFSSHILSDVESLCHRIAFLEKGVLKFEGRVDDALKSGSQEQEILFQNIAKDQVSVHPLLMRAQAVGETFKIIVKDQAEAKQAAETIWALQGRILSLQQHVQSLEEKLFGQERVSK